MRPSGHRPGNSDKPLKQSMSTTTQSNETSDVESPGREDALCAEQGVAGPQPVAQPAEPAVRTFHVSRKFALSLLRRLEQLKVAPPQNVRAVRYALDKDGTEHNSFL
jgi:hypothetical protein